MWWILFTACTGTAEDSAADSAAEEALCADAATVTWNSWGQGFLVEACQGCHASTAVDRFGAPEDATFDTVDEAWAWADRILARAGSDPATMPPQGGVDEDDRQRLIWWLTCAEPGT